MFKDMLKQDETLFKDELVFDYEYLPRILKFRENQQQHFATCIKPLLQGRMGSNLIVVGSPGIGKTAACRFVLREMEDFSEKVIGVYVNCWKADTAYKVVVDICDQLGYKWVQNKKTDELMKEVANILNKKGVVIVLDEVDKLKEEQIIYQLLEDVYKKCLFLITNEKDFLAKLDNRIKSRLLAEVLEFNAYSLDETKEILAERRDLGFFENVFSDGFDLIAEKCFELKDLRSGIYLLKMSGDVAENNSKRKIEVSDVKEAVAKLDGFSSSKVVLDAEEKEILEIIKESSGDKFSEIFKIYNEQFGKSDRTFRRKVYKLKEANLVYSEEKKDEKGSWVVRLFVK
ncbi:AAA family ATPase [archaeon]|jgi:archaeal cell division control protein 6|nr:AAA family ATPase [archaeon]MBT4397183.1 AAA family ATPase [archaeon]MBT4440563.1 AAA family ATPase [archaeon]